MISLPVVEEFLMKVGFFALLVGIPIATILYAGRAPKPKRRMTLEEQYPDEHLGI